jgi:hypothetical protein
MSRNDAVRKSPAETTIAVVVGKRKCQEREEEPRSIHYNGSETEAEQQRTKQAVVYQCSHYGPNFRGRRVGRESTSRAHRSI